MPPRHTKSEFASYLLPAWFLGKYPDKKIIQTSNTAELAVGFGRKVRNLVGSEQYARIFPDVTLRSDSKAAGRWSTNANGEYFAIGVGGTVTGKGADLLIIDDPHKEQDLKGDGSAFDKAWNWYMSGPRQRLQPGGKIVLVMTRWSTKDLTGMLVSKQKEAKADQWELIEFPAIMPSGKPVWPEYWKLDELETVKASLSLGKCQPSGQRPLTPEGVFELLELPAIAEAQV